MQLLATKDGIEITIQDTQKEKYENLGYKTKIFSIELEKLEIEKSKKSKKIEQTNLEGQ